MRTDVLVIGGGPAGMAAAAAAADGGARVLIAEPFTFGGRLTYHIDCRYGAALGAETTGPQFAAQVRARIERRGIERMRTAVVRVGENMTAETAGGDGSTVCTAKAVVLACGGRDVPFSALGIAHTSGARGILTASDALMSHCLFGRKAGTRAVVIGAGGEGMCAAYRLALDGVAVAAIAERRSAVSASAREKLECADDLHIPVTTDARITAVRSDGRTLEVLLGESQLRCDAVVAAAGRRPDLSLLPFVPRDVFGIATVDSSFMTAKPGFFAVGGALHSCGVGDRAYEEGAAAGAAAAAYALGGEFGRKAYWLRPSREVSYVVPARVTAGKAASVAVRPAALTGRGRITLRGYDGQLVARSSVMSVHPGREAYARFGEGEVDRNVFVCIEEEK